MFAKKGIGAPAVIVCSDRAHYACRTVANWLIGEDNVVQVPTTDDNQMQTAELLPTLRRSCHSGRRIACIVATMGTTDAFGLDDLARHREGETRLVSEVGL